MIPILAGLPITPQNRSHNSDAFLATHRRFYLLGSLWIESWLRPYLLERGASLRLVSTDDLYLVDQDR